MVTPREAISTVTFIDNYCSLYRDLNASVRSFEAFKFLHLGMLSEIPRKSLPAIARTRLLSQRPSFTSLFNRIALVNESTAKTAIRRNFTTAKRSKHHQESLTKQVIVKKAEPPIM